MTPSNLLSKSVSACLITSCKGKDNCLDHCPCDCHTPTSPTETVSDCCGAKLVSLKQAKGWVKDGVGRCGKCYCLCFIKTPNPPTEPTGEKWERGFEELWGTYEEYEKSVNSQTVPTDESLERREGLLNLYKETRDLLAHSVQEAKAEMAKEIEKARKFAVLPDPNPYGKYVSVPNHNRVVNQALDGVLASLKQEEVT